MNLNIRNFTIQDYDAAINLWKTEDGIGLSSADERDSIKQFLNRNRGLSKVVMDGDEMVATILCGHDGRRGYLYHLYVKKGYRLRGIGTRLTNAVLDDLKKQGIKKCHLFVFGNNNAAKEFWNNSDWKERIDIVVFSKDIVRK
jgi:ribosomal protein S18 acetylase RimI-like enzyme